MMISREMLYYYNTIVRLYLKTQNTVNQSRHVFLRTVCMGCLVYSFDMYAFDLSVIRKRGHVINFKSL